MLSLPSPVPDCAIVMVSSISLHLHLEMVILILTVMLCMFTIIPLSYKVVFLSSGKLPFIANIIYIILNWVTLLLCLS